MTSLWKIVRQGNRAAWPLAALLGMALTAAAAGPVSPDDVTGPEAWGAVSNVTHLHHLWFAGQPDRRGLEVAREKGVAVVINLREPEELDWDEETAVRELGMAYHNVPVARKGPFQAEAIERIEKLVEENHEQEILVHCASSNRVGGWLAIHLIRMHGMSVDDALAVGRRAGITKDAIEEKVRGFAADGGG